MTTDDFARLVDERDTSWEMDTQDYRVFVVDDDSSWRVYDISGATLKSVISWAEQEVEDHGDLYYSVALKWTNEKGPGLLWLTPDPDDLTAADESLGDIFDRASNVARIEGP